MSVRDEIELALRGWDAYERERDCPPVIDYDCAPAGATVGAVGRLETLAELVRLTQLARAERAPGQLVERLGAHLAYLRARLGERLPLDRFVGETQRCSAAGWPADHVEAVGERARAAIGALGIDWDADTDANLRRHEGEITDVGDVRDEIVRLAPQFDAAVRAATGAEAEYSLAVEIVDVDAYWSYWLDGARGESRLRLNTRRPRFTPPRLRQVVLHEVHGHALQSAAWSSVCAAEDVPWVRLLSVHAPHQVLLEGLAQALPLFVVPDDEAVAARVRLTHYLQLVNAELHVAINAGAPVRACVDHARRRVPFWKPAEIGDTLTDTSVDVLLRSYLWAYPAGVDWFVSLADSGDDDAIKKVLHAAYRSPLSPADLMGLWPAGPVVGGPGGSVRLRDADVP